MLLIIDNQSKFIKKFEQEFLAGQTFDYMFFDHNQHISLPTKSKVKGVILSGGIGNPYEPLNLTTNFIALMNFNVPVLGFCLGHEIIAVSHQGRIKRLAEYNSGKEVVSILKTDDPIFNGLESNRLELVKQHAFEVAELPEEFECLAYSDTCQYEIVRHKKKPVYGFQSHPEVSGTEGLLVIQNFFKICDLI